MESWIRVEQRKQVVPVEFQKKITNQATQIGLSLREPNEVRRTVETMLSQENSKENKDFILRETSLANGFPGFCLLHGELDNLHPDQGWDYIGHAHLIQVQKTIESGQMDVSLWYGLCGVGMAARALSKNGKRYSNFTEKINQLIMKNLSFIIDYSFKNIESGLRMSNYDVGSGLSGVSRYLLFYSDQPKMNQCLRRTLKYFVKLSEDRNVMNKIVHGWHITPENSYHDRAKSLNPYGYFNFGAAHGIIGPLSILSLALIQGIEVSGQKEAIQRIADSIIRWKREDKYGYAWAQVISFEEMVNGKYNSEPLSYDAWCYGTSGIARAIWLAGVAVRNQSFKQIAINSFLGMYIKSQNKPSLVSPTFCHGLIGVLHIFNRMYRETGITEFQLMINELLPEIIDMFDTKLPFYFNNIEKGYQVSNPGLVNGSVGIALGLIGLISESDCEWDATFLIH